MPANRRRLIKSLQDGAASQVRGSARQEVPWSPRGKEPTFRARTETIPSITCRGVRAMCCGSPSLRKWLTLRGAVRLLAFVLGLIVLVGSADGGIENVVIEWPTAGAWVPREFDVTGTASGNPYQPGVVDRLYVDGQATLIKDGRFKKAVRAKGDGPLAVKVECARVYDNGNRVPYWAQSVNVNVDGTKPEIRVTTPNDRSRDVSPALPSWPARCVRRISATYASTGKSWRSTPVAASRRVSRWVQGRNWSWCYSQSIALGTRPGRRSR